MAWQLIAAAALPYVAKGIGQALNKPKEEDFKPQTKYMEKYLSHLKGMNTNREAMHLAMQPALRNIGAESRKTKQELGYQAKKTGVSGSGIEAQMKLSAGQGTQEALAQASATAAANQAAINRRTGEQIAEVSSNIEREEERAAEAFKQAKKQWKQDNINLALEAGASLAGAGLKMSASTQQAKAMAKNTLSPEKIKQLQDLGMSWENIANEGNLERTRSNQLDEWMIKEGIPIPSTTGGTRTYDSTIQALAEKGYDIYVDDPNQTEDIPEVVTEKPVVPTVGIDETTEFDDNDITTEETPLRSIPEFGTLYTRETEEQAQQDIYNLNPDKGRGGGRGGDLVHIDEKAKIYKPEKPTVGIDDTDEFDDSPIEITETPLKPIPEFGSPPPSIKVEGDQTLDKKLTKVYKRKQKNQQKRFDKYIAGVDANDKNEATAVHNLMQSNLQRNTFTEKELGTLPNSDKKITIKSNPEIENKIDELVLQYKNKYGDNIDKKYPIWYSKMMGDLGQKKELYGKMNREKYISGKYTKDLNRDESIIDDINENMGKYGFQYYVRFKHIWSK